LNRGHLTWIKDAAAAIHLTKLLDDGRLGCRKKLLLPEETIIVVSAVVAAFALFMGVLFWADVTSKRPPSGK
jgi:hypothetical protein